jgi:hypothetical protein
MVRRTDEPNGAEFIPSQTLRIRRWLEGRLWPIALVLQEWTPQPCALQTVFEMEEA